MNRASASRQRSVHGLPWAALLDLVGRERLTVLIFHRVLPAEDPLLPDVPDVARFERTMAVLAAYFNVLPMEEAIDRLRRRQLPRRAAAITFDDGYADNLTVAVPVLSAMRLPATFFVATGYLDGGRMWNDTVIEAVRRWSDAVMDLSTLGLGVYEMRTLEQRRAAIRDIIDRLKYLEPGRRSDTCLALQELAPRQLPADLMMTSEQVRELESHGMTVGAHTVAHPILSRVDKHAAEEEIVRSRDALRGILGHDVKLFAYPNGKPGRDYDADHVQMVRRAGFVGAVSTAMGVATSNCDMYQIPRFTPWARESTRFLLQMARNMLRTAPAAVTC